MKKISKGKTAELEKNSKKKVSKEDLNKLGIVSESEEQ
jgi:hypothetical protein